MLTCVYGGRAQISNPILKEDSKSAQLDDTTPAPDKSQLRPPTGGKVRTCGLYSEKLMRLRLMTLNIRLRTM